jgi:hypothetical protein
MSLFVLTFAIVLIVVLAMAVGVLAGRKPIAGSCGGLAAVGVEKACDCDKPCPERLARMKAAEAAKAAHGDA